MYISSYGVNEDKSQGIFSRPQGTWCSGASRSRVEREEMRVMTFNIRFDNDDDGSNRWFLRREKVVGVIKKYRPDLLGTQEGQWNQLLDIRDALSEYGMVCPPERVLDDTCQYPTLFFLRESLIVESQGEFWLSKHPTVHRSKDWDSAFPRMMSYASMKRRDGGTSFWVAVTHLDHMGEIARYEQAYLIATWVKERGGPAILMGDFNDRPGSVVHENLTSRETGLHDTWQVLQLKEDVEIYTAHGF